jgi:hypothetical protein
MRPRGQQARLAMPQAGELSVASGERPGDGRRACSAARTTLVGSIIAIRRGPHS